MEATATYNVRRHEHPIILAASYLPTYPSSSSTALPYGTGTSTEALSDPQRLPAYVHTIQSNARGEHFGSTLNIGVPALPYFDLKYRRMARVGYRR